MRVSRLKLLLPRAAVGALACWLFVVAGLFPAHARSDVAGLQTGAACSIAGSSLPDDAPSGDGDCCILSCWSCCDAFFAKASASTLPHPPLRASIVWRFVEADLSASRGLLYFSPRGPPASR